MVSFQVDVAASSKLQQLQAELLALSMRHARKHLKYRRIFTISQSGRDCAPRGRRGNHLVEQHKHCSSESRLIELNDHRLNRQRELDVACLGDNRHLLHATLQKNVTVMAAQRWSIFQTGDLAEYRYILHQPINEAEAIFQDLMRLMLVQFFAQAKFHRSA